MGLHIIIDGYNLIRQSPRLSDLDRQDIQHGREALIDYLAAYRKVKGHPITVVFDGTAAPHFSQRRDRRQGIEIRFSRSGEQADGVIKKMAAHEKEKAVVVSSDREVARFAQAQGATALDSEEFEDRMILASHGGPPTAAESEASGWRPTTQKKGPRRRLPKNKRRQRLKTSKL
jgi:predicted RNA-binding protein with PIN domain